MEQNEAKLMNEILDCYVQLSPENLWCDGEATREQVAVTEKRVVFKLKSLFRELGREVSEQEAYNFVRKY